MPRSKKPTVSLEEVKARKARFEEWRRLHLSIDRGEAFSHGAAMTLGVPFVTHDKEAINKLGGEGRGRDSIHRTTIAAV
jgi:hypothetical protein